MEKTIYRAAARVRVNQGWLDSWQTFGSEPGRSGFGMLRVLNDDTVAPGMGFRTRTQDNLEMVFIPLEGVLLHRDGAGSAKKLKPGQVQIISAGTGMTHSEYNGSNDRPLKLLQIWVTPDAADAEPHYTRVDLDPDKSHNELELFVAPDAADGAGRIHQRAWFSMGSLDRGRSACYRLHDPAGGVYLLVVAGHVTVAGAKLAPRDGMGIRDVTEVLVTADTDARVLVMEVPVK